MGIRSGNFIKLERTMCFGACPVYELTLYEDGSVVYFGKQFVQVAGRQESSIAPVKFKALVAEFEQLGFDQLADKYGNMTGDAPGAVLTLSHTGGTKIVVHDRSAMNAPQALTDLENKIDEITNSLQWVGKEA